MDWRPAQYRKFGGERLRPGLELLARVPALAARTVVDLGCGSGELTELLAERFAVAHTVGIDSSQAMLEKARAGRVSYELGDIADWKPQAPVDVLFSNAALHWLPDHEALFPRLAAEVAERGVLAVQMPRNFDAPSHQLLRELLAEPRFAGASIEHAGVLAPASYYDLLAPRFAEVDVWETEYQQVLDGEDPVLEWMRGTTLLPVEAALGAEAWKTFLEEYRSRLRQAYPRRADGRTLFPFRRLFIVASR